MVESNRMNFFRQNQPQLRVECYQGLYDHVFNSASKITQNFEKKERLGNLFILPATYIGSPRYMQHHGNSQSYNQTRTVNYCHM